VPSLQSERICAIGAGDYMADTQGTAEGLPRRDGRQDLDKSSGADQPGTALSMSALSLSYWSGGTIQFFSWVFLIYLAKIEILFNLFGKESGFFLYLFIILYYMGGL
jgi:hypothetical protein